MVVDPYCPNLSLTSKISFIAFQFNQKNEGYKKLVFTLLFKAE